MLLNLYPMYYASNSLIPRPFPTQGEIWYTLFVHARNISSFYGIRKITNTYCTFGTYTNRFTEMSESVGLNSVLKWLLLWANCHLVKLYCVLFLL